MTEAGRKQIKADFLAKVNAYASENDVPFSVAMTEITKQNPALWEQYSRATTGATVTGPFPDAAQELLSEAKAYSSLKGCSLSEAFSEIAKREPDLWREYTEGLAVII